MKKRPSSSSIDGFTPRQSRPPLGRATRPMNRSAARPEIGNKSQERRIHQATGTNLKDDINRSLMAIDEEEELQQPTKRRKRLFGRKHDKKPQTRRRKITKRVGMVLLIIGLAVGGFLLWKVIENGTQILKGNPFDIFQKQRLKEDANGRTNVLIFGTSGWSMEGDDWDGAMLTDSIMVVSVDQDNNNAYTMSLPRDLHVGTCTVTGKINEVYWCAQQAGKSDEEAAAEFQKVAGEVLGLDIQYYVHANWKALVQGVDAVGGVDVKIEGTEGQGIYDVATNIRYEEGEVAHMNGEKALAFARARGSAGGYGLSGSNFAREKNQQKLLSALQKKATSAGVLANPAAVAGLLDALGDNLRTSFQTGEVRALIDLAKNTSKITPLPFVGRDNDEPDLMTTGMVSGISVVLPTVGQGNYTEIQAYIKKNLLGSTAATVDVLNGSSIAGLAQRKATELEQLGYIIEAVDNAPAEIESGVQIYQVNESKTKAAEKLKIKYSVSIKTGAPSGYTPSGDTDFVLVFGGGA